MKSAEEWAGEAMYCHRIHVTSAQRNESLSRLIRRIQLDAWKDGQLSGMNLAIEIAKAHKADFISHAIQERLLFMSRGKTSQA